MSAPPPGYQGGVSLLPDANAPITVMRGGDGEVAKSNFNDAEKAKLLEQGIPDLTGDAIDVQTQKDFLLQIENPKCMMAHGDLTSVLPECQAITKVIEALLNQQIKKSTAVVSDAKLTNALNTSVKSSKYFLGCLF